MSINEKQDAIIEEFSVFEDWMEKYEHLIGYGKGLPVIREEYRIPEKLIKGCQSSVWLHAEQRDGKVYFTADSDAIITKGLVALMIEVLNQQPAEDIAQADIYFIDRIGLKSHLSPTRANGLSAMLRQMKLYALAFSKINQS
ncbi:MAG: SufE family protein [Taibaiella sp.]|nr:SufE family protein [Taibaiella sp.]